MIAQILHGANAPDILEADREDITSVFREILLNAMEHGGWLRAYDFQRTRR